MSRDEFLEAVRQAAELEDTAQALRVTEVVLESLGEWLYRTECAELAAELPKGVKELLYKERPPEHARHEVIHAPPEELYNRVKARADVSYSQAVQYTQAVLHVLRRAVSRGTLGDIVDRLPVGFRELLAPEQ